MGDAAATALEDNLCISIISSIDARSTPYDLQKLINAKNPTPNTRPSGSNRTKSVVGGIINARDILTSSVYISFFSGTGDDIRPI
jgi:hypothetical protein